jgi:hypothetical protein
VDRFYETVIEGREYGLDVTKTYQKRFVRHRESLFRFLDEDGIPWNNNTGERAIRHLAVQRKISGRLYQRGAVDYLVLLGIAQTCRFLEKSLLKFLLSKEIDVDRFQSAKRIRYQSRLIASPSCDVAGRGTARRRTCRRPSLYCRTRTPRRDQSCVTA